MPHKFNAKAFAPWAAPRRMSRGGPLKYSDLAITICLTLGMVRKFLLRQTPGLMRGVVRLMGLEISVPDFSTLSRRCGGPSLPANPRGKSTEPIHLVVDSTGVKIFGESEWQQNMHKTKAKRKSWRILHLGLDLTSGEIICADLTIDNVGDPAALPGLLDQVDAPVTRFLADGAYGGAPTSDLPKVCFGDTVKVLIPPPKNAMPSPQSARDPSLRDRHIAETHARGRPAWQASDGYNQRSRADAHPSWTAAQSTDGQGMGRWKGVIGSKLKAPNIGNQVVEVRIGVNVSTK